ncbi:hypothetical protein Tco_0555734 [Tanacetum coccineum]
MRNAPKYIAGDVILAFLLKSIMIVPSALRANIRIISAIHLQPVHKELAMSQSAKRYKVSLEIRREVGGRESIKTIQKLQKFLKFHMDLLEVEVGVADEPNRLGAGQCGREPLTSPELHTAACGLHELGRSWIPQACGRGRVVVVVIVVAVAVAVNVGSGA